MCNRRDEMKTIVQYHYCEADAQLYLSVALDTPEMVWLYPSKKTVGFGHY